VLARDPSIMTPSCAPAADGAGARRHDYRIAIKQFFLREMASNAIYPRGSGDTRRIGLVSAPAEAILMA
jgi:hypothetical protein